MVIVFAQSARIAAGSDEAVMSLLRLGSGVRVAQDTGVCCRRPTAGTSPAHRSSSRAIWVVTPASCPMPSHGTSPGTGAGPGHAPGPFG